ncbi:flagellar biosynthesis anti-sigma factor FlgM [Rickettsiales bacterium]|nr:flagellar biosynthesis anti-sigma factor FlgM [Rickettsiales bacterium]
MVDQIKSNIASAAKPTQSKSSSASSGKNTKISVDSAQKVDNSTSKANASNVSKFINKAAVKEMSVQPPIDKINISRIKNAIASNEYPIDLEKIADALMDAYKEMK